MSSGGRRLRPFLAKARGDREDVFGAFLATALHDADAAQGLALAYASLPIDARHEIIDAVVTDAAAEGIVAGSLLAGLLAVEDDADVARHIAAAMSAAGAAGLAPRTRLVALMTGDEHEGAAVLARPLHGEFMEVLALAWSRGGGLDRATLEPLVHETDVEGCAQELRRDARFERIPATFAIDLLAPVLWSHRRRHGGLPDEVARFADLFTP